MEDEVTNNDEDSVIVDLSKNKISNDVQIPQSIEIDINKYGSRCILLFI